MKTLIGGRRISPRSEPYRFVMPEPQRIGDFSIIKAGQERFGYPARTVQVIWLEATDGSRWLVECK